MGVDQELLPIGHADFVENARHVMTDRTVTNRQLMSDVFVRVDDVAFGLQIQDDHVCSCLGEHFSRPPLVGMRDHRNGQAALENLLQAIPHEALIAQNRYREGWHRDAGHTASWFKTEDRVLLKLIRMGF